MAIAVQLIVGQNEEPFLPYAIRAVNDWVDYFAVCNTSPNTAAGERNREIVYEECKAIRYTTIDPDENGHFSFADARNASLELIDDDDYVLLVDSDDVHYPEFGDLVKKAIAAGADSITAYFYHLMVFKDIFQYTAPREIVFKKYPGTTFAKGVHEVLVNAKRWPITLTYKYMHYGYVKSQREVFSRWKFYSDLEGDYTHYNGQNPDHILDDRISVSKPIERQHPEVIRPFLDQKYPSFNGSLNISNETVPLEKVGLILLTYNDEEYIEKCLTTLYETVRYPDFSVLLLDNGSTDQTIDKALKYLKDEDEILKASEYTSLSESLNMGLDFFRVRHDIQYIGWIHPDMVFNDPRWLHELWQALQTYPKIGKICAANTRDNIPSDLVSGQEQCYIIRKDIVNKIGLFDESFTGIGGYEDWDMNRRIINHDDYKVMITPKAQVYHLGMGTRSKNDTTADQIANAEYYSEKWGTSEPAV